MSNIRLNWVAILVAAIASFLFEALWFSVFMNSGSLGIGRTKEWLVAVGMNPAIQYAVAILCSIIAAAVLSIMHPGLWRADRTSAASSAPLSSGSASSPPAWATEYIFEVRTLQIYSVNAGLLPHQPHPHGRHRRCMEEKTRRSSKNVQFG